jgi:hypothetical protein
MLCMHAQMGVQSDTTYQQSATYQPGQAEYSLSKLIETNYDERVISSKDRAPSSQHNSVQGELYKYRDFLTMRHTCLSAAQ